MEAEKIDLIEIKDNNDLTDQDSSPSSVNEVKIPEIGMTFSCEEEVRTFYNSYAQNVGFGICKLGGRNGDDGKQKYFSIGCAKNGGKVSQAKNILYPRPSTKTNCKAKINVAIRNDGNFVITSLCLEHNHILSPGKSRHFRCNKVLDSAIKRKLELNDQAGITLSKSFQSFVVEAGGYENLTFDERKCRNYISEARRLRHVIKVLIRMKVTEVPMNYIMDRWRKDIKRGYQSISNIYDDFVCDGERHRYNILTPLIQEIQQLGAKNDDNCSMLVEILKDTKEKLIVNGLEHSRVEQLQGVSTSDSKAIHSPLKVRSRGRPPTKRKQSKIEQIVKKSVAKARKEAIKIGKSMVEDPWKSAGKDYLLFGAEDPPIAGMVLDNVFSNLFDLMMLVDVYKICPGEELLPETGPTGEVESTQLVASEDIVSKLAAIGFNYLHCQKAAINTANAGVEEAMTWLLSHMDDPDIDEPISHNSHAMDLQSLDETSVETFFSFGFHEEVARKALKASGGNIEKGTDWIFSHPEASSSMDTDATSNGVQDSDLGVPDGSG
ncbi:hypothetical protein ZIOFF_068174 [Zingiber officinale]|uniref:Ubiquitin carboxyl-terminal hydrolase 14 n=1 Tax=Zingiber officinale TaxID=94328 RepID=A0A8J5CF81_ZINOF|nr:hypothetical protein ZIOFF_068174 [Zingiber officinale]